MMSYFSTFTHESIQHNPLNDSKSKQHYSFGKGERFKPMKTECYTSFHDINDNATHVRRSTGFGFGVKSDFTKTTVSNYAPDSDYQIDSIFDKAKKSNKGKTFGTSRDDNKDKGYISQEILKNPGPGKYTDIGALKKSIAYSMRPKTANQQNPGFLGGNYSNLHNPGPGNYNQEPAIKSNGKYANSKFKSSGSMKFNPESSQRFLKNNKITPGPGSHFKDQKQQQKQKKSFGTTARTTFMDQAQKKAQNTPGVGSYQKPSDFGIYNKSRVKDKTTRDLNNKENQSNLGQIKNMSSFFNSMYQN